MSEQSWLETQYENFKVGAAGIIDATFDTNYAAEVDAEIAEENGELGSMTKEERVTSNTVAEENGALSEAAAMTEQQIVDGATSAFKWGFGFLGLAVVVGAAIGVVYLYKKAGA